MNGYKILKCFRKEKRISGELPCPATGLITARLFGLRLFGLGGVALSRQCGKMNFLKAKFLRFFHTLEASTILPIHAGLLIFIPHIVCVPMYSSVLNLLDMLWCVGRSKSVWRQLRMNTLLPSKGYRVYTLDT